MPADWEITLSPQNYLPVELHMTEKLSFILLKKNKKAMAGLLEPWALSIDSLLLLGKIVNIY